MTAAANSHSLPSVQLVRSALDDLLAAGLVTDRELVDGEVTLSPAHSRHLSFRLVRPQHSGLFVKRATDAASLQLVRREASYYREIEQHPNALSRWIPRLAHADEETGLIVTHLVNPGRTLTEHQSRGRFSIVVATHLGRAIAALHLRTATMSLSGYGSEEARLALRPHGLSIHVPWIGDLRELSPANLELIRLLQDASHARRQLDALAGEWVNDSLIHGDLKGDNVIVILGGGARGLSVRLVDWECAGVGDRAWDVGSVLGDYIGTWLLSILAKGTDTPAQLAAAAGVRLTRIRPPIHAFWRSYLLASGTTEWTQLLVRSVRYAGVRILQSVSEQGRLAERLPASQVAMAQVAVNLALRPEEAAVRLLRLRLTPEAP